jgi:hypothetical protein
LTVISGFDSVTVIPRWEFTEERDGRTQAC